MQKSYEQKQENIWLLCVCMPISPEYFLQEKKWSLTPPLFALLKWVYQVLEAEMDDTWIIQLYRQFLKIFIPQNQGKLLTALKNNVPRNWGGMGEAVGQTFLDTTYMQIANIISQIRITCITQNAQF